MTVILAKIDKLTENRIGLFKKGEEVINPIRKYGEGCEGWKAWKKLELSTIFREN